MVSQLGRKSEHKIDVRWCLLVAVRSMRSCWKEMHNKLVWMHQWRRLGERMETKNLQKNGPWEPKADGMPMVFFDRKKSLLIENLDFFLYAVSRCK